MDADIWMVLIFVWLVTLIGAAGLGTWHEFKDHKPEYKRGAIFSTNYYEEFNEPPTGEVLDKAYYYGIARSSEDLIMIRKKAGLEFALPNSFKEKGVNELK